MDIIFVLQTDEQEVINFLLTTEIIPLALRIMESGSELSKTVSEGSNVWISKLAIVLELHIPSFLN